MYNIKRKWLEKTMEKFQENINKNIFKSFNETSKLNSYFFQAHFLSCTHNVTKQRISTLKSGWK